MSFLHALSYGLPVAVVFGILVVLLSDEPDMTFISTGGIALALLTAWLVRRRHGGDSETRAE